ncbi:MAG TPA: GYF domain-containing protein [Blastocatellia bacterium]|nr:GYF domain-containing protein [Blastocatellia bacterium]
MLAACGVGSLPAPHFPCTQLQLALNLLKPPIPVKPLAESLHLFHERKYKMPTCTNCGGVLDDDSGFCTNCGTGSDLQPESQSENGSEPPAKTQDKIYLHRYGQQEGPYTVDEVRAALLAGKMQANDQAWIEGTSSWVSLSAVPGIAEAAIPISAGLTANAPAMPAAPVIVLSGLPVYYQEEFRKIAGSNEVYKGKWNSAAFLFTFIWALTKGVWLAPLVWGSVFTAILFISCGFGVVLAPVFWILFGVRGNYMYYCASQKNQQIVV